ncbi:hypothetical protein TNCV_5105711 [Trichonephila clavipes]|nr:hypothetical protein TNCV_5105711 [Trichonephila clavipes]
MTHIIRMPDDNVAKKMLQFKVTGIRKRGRPRLRGTDSVESDFGIISEKTWRTKSIESPYLKMSLSPTLQQTLQLQWCSSVAAEDCGT